MPRVLVVEDNPVNLELVLALLDGEGYTMVTAETATEGIRLAGEARPDAILMDMQLPDVTGLEATRALKADSATAVIPVIALTAQAMRGDEQKAREAGCDAYLTKPLDAQLLRQTLRRLLGRSTP